MFKLPYKIVILLIIVLFQSLSAKESFTTKNDAVTVIRNGDFLYIRTAFDQTRDLIQYIDVFGTAIIGNNRPVNFKATYLIPNTNLNTVSDILGGAVLIHNTYDDTAPYYFNGSKSGGNMGFEDLRVVNSVGHGKTVEDVGSEWIDGAGVKWYILRIVNSSTLWMLSENIGTEAIWNFKTVISGNLNHSNNALHTTTIAINSYSSGQLMPSVSRQTKSAFLNGEYEIVSNGTYFCDSLRVTEHFWIPDPAASLDSVKVRSGSITQPPLNLGECHLDISMNYEFDKWGGCTILSTVTSMKELSTPFWGNMQSLYLNRGNYDSLYVYLPNVKPISDGAKDWDLTKLTNLNSGPLVNLSYYNTNWENSEIPPYRMVQYLGSNKADLDIAFSHGYSQTFGHTVPRYRKNNVSIAWTLSNTRKSFPYSLFTANILPEGYIQSVCSFRTYFKPQSYSSKATNVYWFKEKGFYNLLVDYFTPALNDTVLIPPEFNAKGLSVIDKSNTLTILSGDSITDNRLIISSSEFKGYAVVRLYDYVPESDSTAADSLFIRLPEKIYTTTSSKYSVYYNNVILTKNPEKYSFIVDCPVGHAEGNKYNLDSLESGTYNFRLEVRDLFGKMLESDESEIIVTESSICLNDTLKLLFIGDSKTYSGKVQRELQLMNLNSGLPIKFLGTRYNVNNPICGIDNSIYHEGIPGYTWRQFAGYNESSFVFEDGNYWNVYPDCKRYFRELLNGEKPDLVFFMIGLCDIFPCVTLDIEELNEVDKIINDLLSQTNMGKLIDSMEVALPNAKFGVSLIPPANVREVAWNYTWGDSARAWYFRNGQHRLVQRYIDHFQNLNKPRFSMIPMYLNLDSFLGYDAYECIHPNQLGFRQEAETVYAWIKYQISQWMTEPKNLRITCSGGSTSISWDASSGAYLYNIYRSSDPYSGFVKIGTSTSPSYTDPDISGSNKYFYKVTADNSLK